MPGAFQFSEPTTASTALNANMFRPPVSPSASTYNLSKSTGSILSDNTSANNSAPAPKLGRKRTYDESRGSSSYFDKVSALEDSARGQDRYTLAGQIETPGTQVTSGGAGLDDSLYSDIDYRRRLELGSKGPQDDPSTTSLRLSSIALTGTNTTPITPRAAGWTTFAFQAIGGVVGKVWEFCRGGAGAFQGFKAGGGKAYETNGQPVNNPLPLRLSTDFPPYSQEQDNPLSPPGAFPVADVISYIPDSIPDYQDHRQEEIYRGYQEQEEQEEQRAREQQQEQQQRDQERQELQREESPDTVPDRPAPKRRQTGIVGESDELRRNWVMVDENEQQSQGALHHSPLTPSFIPRSGTPSRVGHRRSATSLSAGRGKPPGQMDPQLSPRLDDEAKKLAAQRAAAEKRNTSRLDKLNGELQALIRQGQAALDTEFDVEMGEGDDDGWDEDLN
ncbi:hypothetical protein UCDDA912_g04160 [Diaporthe ampelina]|uniref:Uncharacterized protein n=1 Tax=Diaporthe ampelina TaxID=1214573 RepID=A0A0G2FNH2_9PEZI|nr:hypothetical protein UCDDA912_g04160 [Diaporthe ampelina]